MANYQLVLTTCAQTEDAHVIAKTLLEKKLAACVNVLPQIESFYMWQGKMVQDAEIKLFIKTQAVKTHVLIDTLKQNHPYDVPEIQVINITDGNDEYFSWIDEVLA
jgi:periplasmic divalent cation tolerance protein